MQRLVFRYVLEYQLASVDIIFLNQARTGRRPARAWFLKIDLVLIVGMRVRVCACACVSVLKAINN